MMSDDKYAVVEFVDEKSVEVVVKSWIETCDGVLYCYWPRTNVPARIKKLELPDKKSWKSYKVRIFTYTDSLTKAQKFASRALATSNIESGGEESDNDQTRPRKRTCIRSSMEEFPDYSETEKDDDSDTEISFNATNSKRTPQLPDAPNFMSCSNVNSNLQLPPAWKSSGQTMENPIDLAGCSSTLPGNAMISAFNQILSTNPSSIYNDLATISQEDLFDSPTHSTTPRTFHASPASVNKAPSVLNGLSSSIQITTPPTSRKPSEPSDVNNSGEMSCAPLATGTRRRSSQCISDARDSPETPSTSQTYSRLSQTNNSGFQRSVLTKLDTLIDKHEEALSILRVLLSATKGINEEEVLEDVIPDAFDSVEQFEEFSSRLQDDDNYRKKLLQFLVALGGSTCSNSVRQIMAKLGTNNLWSKYSLKGRKSKRPFKDLSVCRIIIKACLRVHKGCNEMNVEEQIGEFLKYAPSKAGGSKFKDRKNPSSEDTNQVEQN